MSDLTEYFLNRTASVGRYECLTISHPSFSKVYNIVRNARLGINAQGVEYEYYPLEITSMGDRPNLDSGFKINLGDLGEIVPKELDAVALDDAYNVKPIVVWRMYRSDDLTQPLLGPLTLEIKNLAFTREGCSFEAKAPALNNNRTGEIYTITRFPMLRGVLLS
jgi:hypothetical protein